MAALLALGSGTAPACTCAKVNLRDAFGQADAVLKGKVKSIKTDETTFMNTVTVRVKDRWKGKTKRKIKIQTSAQGATCGFPFQEGEEYLIFAGEVKAKKVFKTSLCSGNISWKMTPPGFDKQLKDLKKSFENKKKEAEKTKEPESQQ